MTGVRDNTLRTRARLSSFGLEDSSADGLTPQETIAALEAMTVAQTALPAAHAPVPGVARTPESLHVLTSIDEVRAATETVIAGGQRLISILTPDLEPELYDQPLLLEAVKHFVLSHSFAKVRVLVRDQARLTGGDDRFVAMARRLTSYLEIRIRAAQYRDLNAAYCIADDRAIVYRLRADRWDGIAGFNNPPVARQYLNEFDAMWLASGDEREPQGLTAQR